MRRRSTRLVSRALEALRQIESWPASHAAAGVATPAAVVGRARRPTSTGFGWGSVTKLLAAYAALVAAEEGAVDLDEPAGPEGSTVRHLLAHASGLAWDSPKPLAQAGRAPHLLERGLRRARGAPRGAHGDAVPDVSRTRRCSRRSASTRPSRATRPAGCVGSLGDMLRFGREAAGADADRARDARRGDVGAVPGPGRRAARLRPPEPERLGARLRAPRREVAALDGVAELAARRSATSAPSPGARRSSGSTRSGSSSAPRSRTSRSATGPQRRGPRSRTPCSAKEVEQQPVELGRPLEARQVAGALDRLQARAGDLRGELLGHRLDVVEILGADDDERRYADLGEPGLGRDAPARPPSPDPPRAAAARRSGASSPRSARAPRVRRRPRATSAPAARRRPRGRRARSPPLPPRSRPAPIPTSSQDAEARADQDEPLDEVGPSRRELERDPAAERAADDSRRRRRGERRRWST